jgi:hypothetical protein
MRRPASACILALAIVFSCVSSGMAHRPATSAERDAIAQAMGVPAECATVVVSTVDPAWARFTAAASPSSCRDLGDGWVVLQRQPSDWKVITDGSDIGPCPEPHVPIGVGLDLEICRRVSPGMFLPCARLGAVTSYSFRRRPRGSCTISRPDVPLSEGMDLTHLHWSRWGGHVAHGTGVDYWFHRADPGTRVRLRAWRPRVDQCGSGRKVYTRLTETSRYGTGTLNVRAC